MKPNTINYLTATFALIGFSLWFFSFSFSPVNQSQAITIDIVISKIGDIIAAIIFGIAVLVSLLKLFNKNIIEPKRKISIISNIPISFLLFGLCAITYQSYISYIVAIKNIKQPIFPLDYNFINTIKSLYISSMVFFGLSGIFSFFIYS